MSFPVAESVASFDTTYVRKPTRTERDKIPRRPTHLMAQALRD